MDSARIIADGSAARNCDCILELVEDKIINTTNVMERISLYASSEMDVMNVWQWVVRSSIVRQYDSIIDALGYLHWLCSEPVAASRRTKKELEYAEQRLLQALHFTKPVRAFHFCQLPFATACCFNVDVAWCDTHLKRNSYGDGTMEHIRYLFE